VTVFETERLRARAWADDDAEAAYEIYRDEDVVRFLGSVPQPAESVDAMRARIARWQGIGESLAGTGYGFWALETRDGTLVGATVLKPLPGSELVEVGWHLGKEFWGRGYATESARGALAYGFERLGLDTIHAVIVRENTASIAVARRLGMTYEGATDEFYGKTLELYSTKAPAHAPGPS
jgi:RimJ/RimL family protein N-acetyltransferase